MSVYDVYDAFTTDELADIEAAAQERGMTPYELIHRAVMDNLVY